MRLKISEDKPVVVFVRIKGPKGVRELRAVIDTGSTDCLIPLQDARSLGYDAYFDPFTRVGVGFRGISKTDIFETDRITLEEVSIGGLTAKDVRSMTLELPKWGGIEGVLGNSFLRHFKTCFNFEEGYLDLEPIDNKA
jgi:predicted aspartyl protease